ncbi:hypothetical protein AGMMS49587_04400 [Spirochaetia bacterium]|nr:hypothetical protein AGMMS49587_04400 [Spirochaetia bacterium]
MKKNVRYRSGFLLIACLLTACLFSACDFDEPLEPFIRAQAAPGSTDKAIITAFSVTDGANIWMVTGTPSAPGSIIGATVIVNVTPGTLITGLDAAITHTGASITDGTTEQTGSPASFSAVNFSSPVTFTVKAADHTTQAYTVIVNADPAPFYGFSKGTVTGGDLSFMNTTNPSFLTYAHAGDSITVTFTPNSGYDVTGGAYSYTPAGGSPVTITPTVSGGVGTATITMPTADITVDAAFMPNGSSNAITVFSVSETPTGQKYWGGINETNHTIVVPVPSSVTSLSGMTATVNHTGASITPGANGGTAGGAVSPVTFTGADFTNSDTTPVTYTVTAADTTTQAAYTVSVVHEGTAPPPPSGTYVAYRPAGNGGAGDFYPTLAAAVNEAAGTAANPDAIILINNENIDNSITHPVITISGGKHIRLTSSTNKAINRAASSFGSLITVDATASLELGGFLIIDGDSTSGCTATAALITVNGTLKLGGSVVLQYNYNSDQDGGGVYVDGGTFTMSDNAKISNNYTAYKGGGVFIETTSTFTMSGSAEISNNEAASNGGGVSVYGDGDSPRFTMSDSAQISDNTATDGGGVYVYNGGIFTMTGGTIESNNASNGGGVSVYGDGDSPRFTMSDSAQISGNNATNGGGVYVDNGGIFTMTDGTIESNEAGNQGGGVYVFTGFFTMTDGTIKSNEADDGGGVYVYNGFFTMTDGTIELNKAIDDGGGGSGGGGGVYVYNGFFTMTDGTIESNTASAQGGGIYIGSDGTSSYFSKTGGTIYGSDDPTAALHNTAGSSGGVLYLSPSSSNFFGLSTTIGSSRIGISKVDAGFGDTGWLTTTP